MTDMDAANLDPSSCDDGDIAPGEEEHQPARKDDIQKSSNKGQSSDGAEHDHPSEEATKCDQKDDMDLAELSDPALRPFVIISTSYLLFTITDGAIRMIVLLHAYSMNFSALEVAIMFTFYELAGVFTNLAAGMLGAKWGIKYTLIVGLILQLGAYGMLFAWNENWEKATAMVYVTLTQILAGISKDLTKLGGKTVTKLVTTDGQNTKLFKLVSLLTGFKNSLKGVGYFLGSALIGVSYELALGVMMVLIVLAMPWAMCGLGKDLGRAKKENASLKDIFDTKNWNLNVLSLARCFLFASRDFWFEVPLPFYLRSPPCSLLGNTCTGNEDCTSGAYCNADFARCANLNPGGGCGGTGLDRALVGAFLGGYIILYGQVQSWTPQFVTGPLQQTPPNKLTEVLWGSINCIPTLVASIVLSVSPVFETYGVGTGVQPNLAGQIAWLVTIIITFAIIFAINSSVHSFLVVKYAKKEKLSTSVGLYYMSNACGRLLGCLGSGFLYTYVGEYFNEYAGNDATTAFASCFIAGTVSSAIAALITLWIKDEEAGLRCGNFVCINKAAPEDGKDEECAVEEGKVNVGGMEKAGVEHNGK